MLWGVGPKTAEALERHGILTIGDVAECEEEWLHQNFGKRGPELRERALGIDPSPVSPHRDTKSVSSETTMATDVHDEAVLRGIVEELSRDVAGSLQGKGLKGKTLSIKLRLSDFTTFTRQTTLGTPTNEFEVMYLGAYALMRKELTQGRRFRLVGVGMSNFREEYQLPLMEEAGGTQPAGFGAVVDQN